MWGPIHCFGVAMPLMLRNPVAHGVGAALLSKYAALLGLLLRVLDAATVAFTVFHGCCAIFRGPRMRGACISMPHSVEGAGARAGSAGERTHHSRPGSCVFFRPSRILVRRALNESMRFRNKIFLLPACRDGSGWTAHCSANRSQSRASWVRAGQSTLPGVGCPA